MKHLTPGYGFLWPKISYFKQELILHTPKYHKIKQKIKRKIKLGTHCSNVDTVRYIRNWINTNSTHLIDDEHDRYAFKVHIVLQKLLQYSLKNGNLNPPHLSCGPRSYAMKEVLKLFGFKSRVIDIFHLENNKINPHTLLEVFCSDMDKWILQDPDFNTEYHHNSNNENPLSCKEIFTYSGSELNYKTNGFVIENEQNCINTLSDNFNCCYLYRNSYDGNKSHFFLKEKEDLDQKMNDNDKIVTFREYINVRGFNPRIFFISK